MKREKGCVGLKKLERLRSIWSIQRYEKLPRFCFQCGRIKHGLTGCPAMAVKELIDKPYGVWLRADSTFRRAGGFSGGRQTRTAAPSGAPP